MNSELDGAAAHNEGEQRIKGKQKEINVEFNMKKGRHYDKNMYINQRIKIFIVLNHANNELPLQPTVQIRRVKLKIRKQFVD